MEVDLFAENDFTWRIHQREDESFVLYLRHQWQPWKSVIVYDTRGDTKALTEQMIMTFSRLQLQRNMINQFLRAVGVEP